MEDGLGDESITREESRVSLDHRLRELPRDELLKSIARQANPIRILHKARQRAEFTDELERPVREQPA